MGWRRRTERACQGFLEHVPSIKGTPDRHQERSAPCDTRCHYGSSHRSLMDGGFVLGTFPPSLNCVVSGCPYKAPSKEVPFVTRGYDGSSHKSSKGSSHRGLMCRQDQRTSLGAAPKERIALNISRPECHSRC